MWKTKSWRLRGVEKKGKAVCKRKKRGGKRLRPEKISQNQRGGGLKKEKGEDSYLRKKNQVQEKESEVLRKGVARTLEKGHLPSEREKGARVIKRKKSPLNKKDPPYNTLGGGKKKPNT